jgi:transposase-like protein
MMICFNDSMTTAVITDEVAVKCPTCNSEATYKYGRAKTGRQRLLCLICGRQFTIGARKHEIEGKPFCPECGSLMHLYKIDGDIIRFRCSDYPQCKGLRKFKIIEEE